VGLKFHPQMLPLQADSEKYDAYLKIAEKYNLPCLFHSDTISSASDPKFIYELGKRHPKVPIILGHLGLSGAANHENAISVLKESIKNGDAKLYADFAWTDVEYIKKAISELKNLPRGDFSNRLLFGTDAPLGEFNDPNRKVYDYYPNRISQIKSMIESNFKDDAKVITDKIFYQNSADLFNLDAKTVTQGASNVEVSSKNKVVEKAVKKGGKHTIAVIIGLCLLGVGAAVVAKVLNKNHKKQLQQVGTNNLQGDKLSTLG